MEFSKYKFHGRKFKDEDELTDALVRDGYQIHVIEKNRIWIIDTSDESSYREDGSVLTTSYDLLRYSDGSIQFKGIGPLR